MSKNKKCCDTPDYQLHSTTQKRGKNNVLMYIEEYRCASCGNPHGIKSEEYHDKPKITIK